MKILNWVIRGMSVGHRRNWAARRVAAAVTVWFTCVVGAGAAQAEAPAVIDQALQGLQGSVSSRLRAVGCARVSLLGFDVTSGPADARLVNDLALRTLQRGLAAEPGLALIGEAATKSFLRDEHKNVRDLLVAETRQEYLRQTGGGCLLLLRAANEHDQLSISCRYFGADLAGEAESLAVTIEKTDEVRVYLHEPVPGTLVLQLPGDASATLDGAALESSGHDPITRRLDPGNYQVVVQKPGYAELSLNVSVDDHQKQIVKVTERRVAGAPVKAILASALVPGLGGYLYGRPKWEGGRDRVGSAEWSTFVSAVVCYSGIGAWIYEKRLVNTVFSSEAKKSYDKWVAVDLLVGAAGYAANLMYSASVGHNYAARNRQLMIATDEPRPVVRPLLGAMPGGRTPAMACGVSLTF